MLQHHAVQELHGEERLTILFANVVNGADVGMIQLPALHARQPQRVAGNFVAQELEGDDAVMLGLLGLVRRRHHP
ncbi:MAG TPA: hypothetical protein VEI52_25800 [Terriglobales bacterium]|nr:hypothetical protein [Terriglobales bacterium]